MEIHKHWHIYTNINIFLYIVSHIYPNEFAFIYLHSRMHVRGVGPVKFKHPLSLWIMFGRDKLCGYAKQGDGLRFTLFERSSSLELTTWEFKISASGFRLCDHGCVYYVAVLGYPDTMLCKYNLATAARCYIEPGGKTWLPPSVSAG